MSSPVEDKVAIKSKETRGLIEDPRLPPEVMSAPDRNQRLDVRSSRNKCFCLIQPCNEAHTVEGCVCVCVCVYFSPLVAPHRVGISPFVLQLISANATKAAQPSNFISGPLQL